MRELSQVAANMIVAEEGQVPKVMRSFGVVNDAWAAAVAVTLAVAPAFESSAVEEGMSMQTAV